MWPTVKAIAAPTPMGAKYMTTLVNLNMTSLRVSTEAQDGGAFCLAEGGERDAEEDGEDGDLEDLAFGDGLGDVLGEDVQEEVVPVGGGDLRAGFRRTRRRRAMTRPTPALRDVDGDEADDEGEGGERLRSRRGS